MDFETIIYEKEDGVGIVRLNRPERMNAVIEEMYRDLQSALGMAESDGQVRVLILTGSVRKHPDGDKEAFCAGADLKKHAGGQRTAVQRRQYILLGHETCRRLHNFPKPVIVAVNGPARGAGAEMALNGDFLFMADTATIGFPETSLGSFVGGGVTRHLTQIIGMMRAKELIYGGRVLNGPESVGMGLALKSVPVANLMDDARAFARELAAKAPISMAFAKSQIQEAPGRDLQTVLLLEADAILATMHTEDWQEGVRSFAERRPPVYRGR